MLGWAPQFDPFQSARVYHLELVETAYSSLYLNIVIEALQQAPNIKLKTKTWNQDTFERLIKRDADFGIGMVEFDERSTNQVQQVPK
ncbi:hypothetical protein VTH8203_03996 [Vibrio thalassae]|uniref:LysR substrate binding domain protein n=2 Tax=Vibrio thalassae TaxID=1243014 RepID=A0A240EP85_9VIBR|nr:hypothetical protein VTH8203_03996 [Vibrio thalassae]